MKRTTHGWLQLLAAGLQVANVALPFLGSHQMTAAAVLAGAQAVLGVYAQKFNTDGTPQAVAFQAPDTGVPLTKGTKQ